MCSIFSSPDVIPILGGLIGYKIYLFFFFFFFFLTYTLFSPSFSSAVKCYFSKSECTAIGNLQNLTCLMNTSDNQGDLLHYADHCTWFRPLHMRFWYFCAGRRHRRTIQPSCKSAFWQSSLGT